MASSNSSALILPPTPVSGTNSAALQDIHGIRPPVVIPSGYWWILWTALAAAVAFGLWKLWRKWQQKRLAPKPVVVIPPHRKAKDRLRSAEELLSDPYRFCSLVSDVVRVYLEERFDLHAPERTTEEFLYELTGNTVLNPQHKQLLEDFLTRCDLVKFARFEPSQEELRALLDSALRLIDETAPVATPDTQVPAQAA
jgi:hypothetical protein